MYGINHVIVHVGRRDDGVKDDNDIFRSDYLYSSPSLSIGDMFPDPQGMPETVIILNPVYTMSFPIPTYLLMGYWSINLLIFV